MKLLIFTLIFSVFICFFCTNAFASFSGGDGTQQNPFQISSLNDWYELRDSVLYSSQNHNFERGNWTYGKYFELTKDITDAVTNSIGTSFYIY
jgi:hypothetical protein